MLLSCAAAVPFVYFMCPETTGKSLEEIDLLFADVDPENTTLGNETDRSKDQEIKHGSTNTEIV